MKILAISDSHGSYKSIDESPDVVLLLGDIDYYELRKIDTDFSCPKFGVLGNHDGFDYFDGTHIINLHGVIVDFQGLKLAGFEGSPKYNKRMFGQFHEEDVKLFTRSFDHVDLFIAHSNPMLVKSHDETDPHRGFEAFTEMMLDAKVSRFLHGHVHKDEEYKIGETSVYSVYPHKIIII